jgi:hypothetical protein
MIPTSTVPQDQPIKKKLDAVYQALKQPAVLPEELNYK